MRIPDTFLQSLRERADIVSWIQERVPLRKMGVNYGACCPFHEEKTPSFTVSATKQFFHCFGCGAHGDVIAFVSRFDGLPFVEAVQKIAAQIGLTVPQDRAVDSVLLEQQKQLMDLCQEAVHFYTKVLHSSHGAPARAYLKTRGLSQQTVEAFGLGYAPERWDAFYTYAEKKGFSQALLKSAGLVIEKRESEGIYDRFRGRLMFPIQDSRGRYVGFGGRILGPGKEVKYLNSPETPIFHKGQVLYGLSQAMKRGNVPAWIVVEGYMDVITLYQAGVVGAVATMGTALTIDHIKRLGQSQVPLYFCFDGDEAGQKAAWRALQTCLAWMEAGRSIFFIQLPAEEDPDSLVRRLGREGFERYQREALGFSDFFFEYLSKQVSMQSMEGRARLVALAEPLLKQMPEGVYVQMMRTRLRELAGLNGGRSVWKPRVGGDFRGSHFPKEVKKAVPLAKQARWLLGAFPQFGAAITEEGWQVLQGLPADEGAWFQSFRSGQGPVEEAAAKAWLALVEGEEAALVLWTSVVEKLIRAHRERQIEGLLQKAKRGALEPTEKQALKRLLES